ncbi:amidase [Allorhizobium sp. BGMRC 0089]|uniref:amidase n=1 Tax=Allorhizobium sonneratiae TaxID=2934936 RepID=UPI0020340C8E|nr:amidase [Allorhizobium sonneratiae]MCM2293882.1 amidase [Allorhizobium sonneratiae]
MSDPSRLVEAGEGFDPPRLADPLIVDRIYRDGISQADDTPSANEMASCLPPLRQPLPEDPAFAGVTQLLGAFADQVLRPSEVLEQLKERIAASACGREAVLRLVPGAEEAARESDHRYRQGRPRPLEGIAFGIKDIIDVEGAMVTSGSHLTEDRVAAADACVVAALRAAGAIAFAMTATTEFAAGSPHNPRFGTVSNPYDRDRWTGGSSTGSGAALAARLMPLALGTDTGGSIRVPSCWCGTSGLKPSRELVSRRGVSPLSWTLDHVGPMARSAQDIARVLPFLADGGKAELLKEVETILRQPGVQGLRLGVPVNWFADCADRAVLDNWQAALKRFEELGCRLVSLPHLDIERWHQAGWVILQSELASLYSPRLDRAEDFDPGFLGRLKAGLGFSAADYGQALQSRAEAMQQWLAAMETVDAVVTPGIGGEAGRLADLTVEIDRQHLGFQSVISRNTMIFDLIGFPALMLPSGLGRSGLPTGIQIVAKPRRDALSLRLGMAYQTITDWHRLMPKHLA